MFHTKSLVKEWNISAYRDAANGKTITNKHNKHKTRILKSLTVGLHMVIRRSNAEAISMEGLWNIDLFFFLWQLFSKYEINRLENKIKK